MLRKLTVKIPGLAQQLRSASGRLHFLHPVDSKRIGCFLPAAEAGGELQRAVGAADDELICSEDLLQALGGLEEGLDLLDESGASLGWFIPTTTMPSEIVARGEAILAARPIAAYDAEQLISHGDLWQRILTRQVATS